MVVVVINLVLILFGKLHSDVILSPLHCYLQCMSSIDSSKGTLREHASHKYKNMQLFSFRGSNTNANYSVMHPTYICSN